MSIGRRLWKSLSFCFRILITSMNIPICFLDSVLLFYSSISIHWLVCSLVSVDNYRFLPGKLGQKGCRGISEPAFPLWEIFFYFLFRWRFTIPRSRESGQIVAFVFPHSTQQFTNMISATADEPLHGWSPDLHYTLGPVGPQKIMELISQCSISRNSTRSPPEPIL